MSRISMLAAGLALLAIGAIAQAADTSRAFAIVIHGGAGAIPPQEMTAEREAGIRAGLNAALDAGYAILERGGPSLDAVAAAVRVLEDNPQFNAGRGAVLTHTGEASLDASIMDGKDLRAGAVAGVQHVKNPIDLARLVMEKSPHVMLSGAGAEEFALAQGVQLVPNDYFITERRRQQLERAIDAERAKQATETPGSGTVGAVALDRDGNIAAATSTGGMTNKRNGRIGDSPIIGAGTYANNASCAVSSTGHGEYFIRSVVAHDICALVEYRKTKLDVAARTVLDKVTKLGGDGGVIAIDTQGHAVMELTSGGMPRGVRDSKGRRDVLIFRDR